MFKNPICSDLSEIQDCCMVTCDDGYGAESNLHYWDQILVSDFFTIEVWTSSGLTRFIVLFFIDLSTRRVEIGGIANCANGLWMAQIARNATDALDGFFNGKRYLIHDRDQLYTKNFLACSPTPASNRSSCRRGHRI
jgi:hypothetical protein